jgi:hypothetical protein
MMTDVEVFLDRAAVMMTDVEVFLDRASAMTFCLLYVPSIDPSPES